METQQTGDVAVEAKQHGDRTVEVHVKSLKNNETTSFKVSEETTVGQVWDEAIDPDHLDEERQPGDTFRCADGHDLTHELDLTMAQLQEQHVCMNRHFEIRGGSGGA